MIYLLFVSLAVVATALILLFGARKGVVDIGKWDLYKPCEEGVEPFRGKPLILIAIICFVVALAVQISLYYQTSVLAFVKLFGLLVIVLSAALIDIKRRIIPNMLILCGLVFRLGIYVYEFITAENIKAILLRDLLGFVIGFLFLAIVSFATKGAIGFGDAKLFGLIGLLCGPYGTYSTLLVSLIVSTVFSVINIVRKKMGRKDAFPFGPFIAIGYVLIALIGSY